MRRSIGGAMFIFCLPFCVALAQTQTVYEVRGPNGPVYSDKPMPGARAIELPPLNVVDFKSSNPATFAPPSSTSPASPVRKPESGKVIASDYRSFAIVAPEENGSIVAPAAVFEVRLALDPALLLGEGHAFTVSINGKPIAQRFTASEFMIPSEFWGDSLPPPNQRYQLSARIVDRDGATLKEALPVVFTLRNELIRPIARPIVRPLMLPLPLSTPTRPPQVQEAERQPPAPAKSKAEKNLLR
jgi:hypothetical protein